MNTIFKHNVNAKYSTKDLKGGYNSNNLSLLDVFLDEKGTSVKIQLLNIFKDSVDSQQAFRGMFNALINEDYSSGIDIERYQGLLEHALSKVDFSVVIGIYMLLKHWKDEGIRQQNCSEQHRHEN